MKTITISEEDAKIFLEAYLNPPPPTPKALKAAKSYRHCILHDDSNDMNKF